MRTATILLGLLLAASAAAQEPTAKRLASPHDAVTWAGVHVQTLPADQRPHVRYFWDHFGDLQNGQLLSFTLNAAVSQSPNIIQPQLVPGTNNQLWWIDLRWVYPEPEDYVRGHGLFESLDVQEPYFHVFKEIDKVVTKKVEKIIDVPRYYHQPTRRWYTKKRIFVDETQVVGLAQVSQLNALVCDPVGTGGLLALTTATRSNNPIMRVDWFIVKALTTENNGYYYKFAFIDGSKDGKSAQALFLARLGADEKLVAELESDNRTIVFRSGVAGRRPRMVELYFGVNARPISGFPLVTMTHDIFEGDVDPKLHPLRNLTSFYNVKTGEIKDRARECIGTKRNGFQIYGLFDGNGNLQNRVPDKIAYDETVPSPFSKFLQPGISCIRCHGSEDGWMPLRNDLHWMLSRQPGKPRLDFFDDLDSEETTISTVDRLAGQFNASDQRLDNALRLARNGYADAVFRATKFSALRVQGLEIPAASRLIENLFARYVYEPIDQHKACYELGFDVEEQWAAALFDQVLPPLPVNAYGFSPEDPIIGGIRSGTPDRTMGVSRFEWEQVFQDAKVRVLTQQALMSGRTKE